MQVVIDIPEEMYAQIIDENSIPTMLIPYSDIIRKGTPLPKGHGRLIDADALIHWHRFESKSDNDIANAPTIIEADKGE